MLLLLLLLPTISVSAAASAGRSLEMHNKMLQNKGGRRRRSLYLLPAAGCSCNLWPNTLYKSNWIYYTKCSANRSQDWTRDLLHQNPVQYSLHYWSLTSIGRNWLWLYDQSKGRRKKKMNLVAFREEHSVLRKLQQMERAASTRTREFGLMLSLIIKLVTFVRISVMAYPKVGQNERTRVRESLPIGPHLP